MITFISGGVRSGKSRFAEAYVEEKNENRKIYIATALAYDDEMKKRIERHKKDRQDNNWITIEQSKNIKEILDLLQENDVVLLDCLTLLVSNEMFDGDINIETVEKVLFDIKIVDKKVKNLIIVSNDIFEDINTYDKETNEYLSNLGRLHMEIIKIAGEAYECVVGIPIQRK